MKKIKEHVQGVDFYPPPTMRLTSLFEGRRICVGSNAEIKDYETEDVTFE